MHHQNSASSNVSMLTLGAQISFSRAKHIQTSAQKKERLGILATHQSYVVCSTNHQRKTKLTKRNRHTRKELLEH